ncbi:MAG TPA: GntR family transcriptional regulator [Thermoleophilaceae bacterium]|jgi:DNA-binding transcriptional regulator YhcF (GntR family)|nr:GntR family transcriptional regulator [Thermoleophilaceae bacterium]
MSAPLDFRIDRGSDVPLGTQLSLTIRDAIADGSLSPGDRLPSVRELAQGAGVNVNTVRAVYARLEAEGAVRSEHGRGTFVAGAARAPMTRGELREQIAALEATLARLPPPPLPGDDRPAPRPAGAALLSRDELVAVRDHLLERLGEVETERTALIDSLERLGVEPAGRPAPSGKATASLANARIRWVGA